MIILVGLLCAASSSLAQAADAATGLSDLDVEILERGPYDTGAIVGGGLLGTVVGFGTGHYAQERWRDGGWIFTAGESVSLSAVFVAMAACPSGGDDDGLQQLSDSADCVVPVTVAAGVAFLGFRVAELIDVWVHPQRHNRRFRELEAERARQAIRWSPYVVPREAGGASFGLALRF